MIHNIGSEAQTTELRGPNIHLIWAGVLTLVFIAAYWVPLTGIVDTWATNDDYSYGFLIPVVSAYLFWELRHRAKGLELRPFWGALPVLILFIIVSIYGILGSSGNVSRPAVPIVFMLMFAFTFGFQAFKRFVLPLAFLIFMVPLPALLDRTFGVFLKSVSSQMGVAIIRACGLSVYVSGNVIDLGATQLQVADACSGLRFVFPLVALGILYAYFFEKIIWKQVFCVVATVPIAILTNGLRIGITGILTHYIGQEMAQGFFHDFSGWAIFMAAFLFLFILGRILRYAPPNLSKKASSVDSSIYSGKIKANFLRLNKYAYLIAVLLLALVGILSFSTSTMPPVKLKGGIAAFPKSFNGWLGSAQALDAEITERSGAEEAFSSLYRKATGEAVSLYIGYRSTSFLENENFFHSPTVCLPSSGWKQLKTSTHVIPDVPVFGQIKVTKMVVEQMGYRQLVYFWFQTKDKTSFSKDINRFHLAMHAIRRDNTYDLFIRPIITIPDGESAVEAQRILDGFVKDMMPELISFLKHNQS